MARTPLTPIDVPEDYTVDGIVLTWTASDNVNGNCVAHTGREIVLARNDNVGPQTVAIDSVVDPQSREGDYLATIATTLYWVSQMFRLLGWRLTDNTLHSDGSAADVCLCVIRIP